MLYLEWSAFLKVRGNVFHIRLHRHVFLKHLPLKNCRKLVCDTSLRQSCLKNYINFIYLIEFAVWLVSSLQIAKPCAIDCLLPIVQPRHHLFCFLFFHLFEWFSLHRPF